MTEQLVKTAGRIDICSMCGDMDFKPYRTVDEPSLTLRLCADCMRIQKQLYGSSFDPILDD